MELSEGSKDLVRISVVEDLGTGDLTSSACIPEGLRGKARILAREKLVCCGHQVAQYVCEIVDPLLIYEVAVPEGALVEDGVTLATLQGPMRSILAAERTVLNFLQRLSGISTSTSRLVACIRQTGAQLFDTRKTTPGFRQLEKHAVKIGGGNNHRFGLYDAVLIKNNHIDALGGSLERAVKACQRFAPQATTIEVEVRNQEEFEAAVSMSPDIVLLDNMTPPIISQLLAKYRSQAQSRKILFEASGGIHEGNLLQYAETGVDRISLGMLTHSVHAVDISLRYEP